MRGHLLAANRLLLLSILVTSTLVAGRVHASVDEDADTSFIQHNLGASDPHAFDEFGSSVAIYGNFAVVGAPYHDVWDGLANQSSAGAAYVYERTNNTWSFVQKLESSIPQQDANFGISVGIGSGVIAVGAVGYDSATENDVGAVYIFTHNDDQWEVKQILESGADEAGEGFGSTLDLAGKVMIIGAPYSDINGTEDAGAAYIFIGSSGSWFQQDALTASAQEKDATYGYSVSTDGTHVLVGSPSEGNYGGAYLYEKGSLNWTLSAYLNPGDGREGDFFGAAVSIDGDRAAVGASLKDPHLDSGTRVTNGGGVYVFKNAGASWNREVVLILEDAGSFDNLGASLDLNGKLLIVGARGRSNFGLSNSGQAYIFQRSGSEWSSGGKLIADQADGYEYFGEAVATNGTDFLVGAIGRDYSYITDSGQVFAFRYAYTLPETGFPLGQVVELGRQPASSTYSSTSLTIAIPKLDLEADLVGVPFTITGWDTTWLDNQLGYLETTAFPTMPGNSVISGHVWDANNLPGPFIGLRELRYGDRILIYAWGATYVYEVRSTQLIAPRDLSVIFEKPSSWITLITCEGFDPENQAYDYRRVVQAVLTEVIDY